MVFKYIVNSFMLIMIIVFSYIMACTELIGIEVSCFLYGILISAFIITYNFKFKDKYMNYHLLNTTMVLTYLLTSIVLINLINITLGVVVCLFGCLIYYLAGVNLIRLEEEDKNNF